MSYDTMSGGVLGIPPWRGSSIVYDRGWMILEHLRRNGYGTGRDPIYKETRRVEQGMATLISALEQGHETTVREQVQHNLRFLTAQQLAATSR